MESWTLALELDHRRSITIGSQVALRDAIRNGADLRIYTEFRHNEHIDTSSENTELIREAAEFRASYLVDDRWVAGIMTQRQPVDLPEGFGQRASMSFFMYNEDGQQAVARPYLDSASASENSEPSEITVAKKMPKYHLLDTCDENTNAPSRNFVYDFEIFRYLVRDDWQEVLSHNADGSVNSGSVGELADAFSRGVEVKVSILNACQDLVENDPAPLRHEVFIQLNSCYFYTKKKLFIGATHPLVRVRPSIPMEYRSGGWDFGWMVVRSDGHVTLRLVDPYTLSFRDKNMHHSLRWFIR